MIETNEEARVVALDIDGTVLEESKPIDWNDALDALVRTKPFPAAIRRIQELQGSGHIVHFVTNRRPVHGQITARQLVKALGGWPRGAKLYLSPGVMFDGTALVGNKMDTLRILKPDVYIGDLDGDRLSADLAGVPFMLAKDWRAGACYPWERPARVASALTLNAVPVKGERGPRGDELNEMEHGR